MRRDLQADKREEFDYDGLYRLSQSRRYPTAGGSTPAATDHFTYDNLGNLSNKGGAPGAHTYSNYNYGTRSGCSNTVIRPHAVYQVTVSGTTRRYCYDGNGNVISVSRASGSGPLAYDTTSWWVANLARRISQGSSAGSEFEYGPDRERIRQVAQKSANLSETTLYVGGLYEKLTRVENGTTTTAHVHYIRGGTDTVAIYKKTVNGPVETRYLHRDHLGSVVAATDTAGAVLERYSYDPWGKRRDPGTWQTPAPGTFSHDPVFSDRGYTGHEHLDHVGLVNMNGRVYDPEIGRFLSADPYVQFPESTQGYNRYSYVGNNPLSYTDPSGFLSFRKVLQAAGIILSFVLPGSAAWVQGALLDSMLKGFVAGFLSAGGDLRGGLLGAFGAGLFYGTHLLQARFSLGSFAHSLIKALAGGLLSAAAGGKFGEGFLGAFAGGFLGEKMEFLGGATGSGDFSDMIVRVVRDAVIGGIASELGGGKFRNGAITAAFARLYNDEQEIRRRSESAEAEERSKTKYGLWVEESSPGEPGAHVSLGIGDPLGSSFTVSFGWEEGSLLGGTGSGYLDVVTGGTIDEYYPLTPDQARAIADELARSIGVRGTYNLATNNCRHWTYDTLESYVHQYRLVPGPIPSRVSTPNGHWPLGSSGHSVVFTSSP